MGKRAWAIGLMLPLLLAACGGSHQSSQPAATTDPALLDQRMKAMQADLEQMRLQQEQMKQQQEQQRQQELQLLYQQRQAAAASGAATAAPDQVQTSAPPPESEVPPSDYFPAFQWFDPTAPKQKLDKLGNDQKL
jgi:TolA-binding protein